ncbi:MAG: carboxypeptidase-like regulatory domain-containing protein [Acidobacteriota bacterium]
MRRLFFIAILLLANTAGAGGLSIESQVLGPDGKGLAGARVELRPVPRVYDQGVRELEGKGEPEPAARAVSVADGWFRIPVPAEGPWRVRVTAEGFPAQESQPWMVIGEETLAPARMGAETVQGYPWQPVRSPIRRAAGSRPFRVEVYDGGKAVAGAILRDRESLAVLGRTGADGSLLLDAPVEKPRQIRVETRDGRISPFDIKPIPAALKPKAKIGRRLLLLPPAVALAGRVVDQATGRPIAGARVWPGDDPGAFQVADERGAYRLPAWTAKTRVWLGAVAEGHFGGSEPFFVEESRATPPTLALRPSRFLEGIVVDEEDRPVAQAEVRAFFTGSAGEGTRVRTSARGIFKIVHPSEPANVELLAYRPGLTPALLGVAIPTDDEIRLVLGRGRTARGRVVDESGDPVAGAQVEMARNAVTALLPYKAPADRDLYRATADGDGWFEVAGLPARWFDLAVVREGFRRLEWRAVDLGEDAGKDVDLGTLVLRAGEEQEAPEAKPDDREKPPEPEPSEPEAGATLAGRVTAPDGSPAPGAAVVCNGLRRVRDVADGDGFYEIRGLVPGFCTVLAWHDTFGRRTLSVEFGPGETRLDISLEPFERPREIRGRVVGPGGDPLQGALVENRPEGFLAFTAADGSFALKTNETGFDLLARKPGYAPARLFDPSDDAPTGGLELRLGSEVFLSGRVLGVDPDRLPEVQVVAVANGQLHQGGVGPDGIYRVLGLEPGAWAVSAWIDKRVVATRTIEIAPGETEPEVDLEFDPEP